jgi:aryl-alcohol dehydrogenase-like predicted oxidoreductase
MDKRTLGAGLQVSAIGLGCMGMSSSFPPFPEQQEMVRLIRTAVDRGLTFFDTAQVYAPSPTRSSSAKLSSRSATRL